MKANLHTLKLVHPPISNFDAERVKNEEWAREVLSNSHLYMICQKEWPRFFIPDLPPKDGWWPLGIEDSNTAITGYLKLSCIVNQFVAELDAGKTLAFGQDKTGLRIFEAEPETREFIKELGAVDARTVLYLKSTHSGDVAGFEGYQDFVEYKLHYVGISKEDDSFKRLVVKPHDKRLRIVSSEYPEREASRVTDEVILLFFRIEPLVIQVWGAEDEIEDLPTDLDYMRVIADAEKAFVSILKSSYNKVQFKDYPQGKDGLYNTGLTRYGYLLGEEITLVTDTAKIRGDYSEFMPNSDMIFIEGDKVELCPYKGMKPKAGEVQGG